MGTNTCYDNLGLAPCLSRAKFQRFVAREQSVKNVTMVLVNARVGDGGQIRRGDALFFCPPER